MVGAEGAVVHRDDLEQLLLQIAEGGLHEGVVEPTADGGQAVVVGVVTRDGYLAAVQNEIAHEEGLAVRLGHHVPLDGIVAKPVHLGGLVAVDLLRSLAGIHGQRVKGTVGQEVNPAILDARIEQIDIPSVVLGSARGIVIVTGPQAVVAHNG